MEHEIHVEDCANEKHPLTAFSNHMKEPSLIATGRVV